MTNDIGNNWEKDNERRTRIAEVITETLNRKSCKVAYLTDLASELEADAQRLSGFLDAVELKRMHSTSFYASTSSDVEGHRRRKLLDRLSAVMKRKDD